jgi:hypothetical protein
MTIASGDSVSASVLNTDSDQHRADLKAATKAGDTLVVRSFTTQSILSGTDIRDRSLLLVLDDDARLECLGVTAFGESATSQTITGILDVLGGAAGETSVADDFLQGETVSTSVALTTNARVHSRNTTFATADGTRAREIWLKKGRLYRLSLTNSHAGTTPRFAQVLVVLTMRRRK